MKCKTEEVGGTEAKIMNVTNQHGAITDMIMITIGITTDTVIITIVIDGILNQAQIGTRTQFIL